MLEAFLRFKIYPILYNYIISKSVIFNKVINSFQAYHVVFMVIYFWSNYQKMLYAPL